MKDMHANVVIGTERTAGSLGRGRVPSLMQRNSRRPNKRVLCASVEAILLRHAAVGLALGVVRDRTLEVFCRRAWADIASNTPITGDTVFRIGSITKLFTAIAVMHLHEQGL